MTFDKRASSVPDHVTVTFHVSANIGATTADLVGEFTDWRLVAMDAAPDGSLSLSVDLPVEHAYRFRYLLDGERWENDWAADRYVPNDHGGDDSVVDARWPNPFTGAAVPAEPDVDAPPLRLLSSPLPPPAFQFLRQRRRRPQRGQCNVPLDIGRRFEVAHSGPAAPRKSLLGTNRGAGGKAAFGADALDRPMGVATLEGRVTAV